MTAFTSGMPEPHAIRRIRTLLLGTLAAGAIGTGAELLLLGLIGLAHAYRHPALNDDGATPVDVAGRSQAP